MATFASVVSELLPIYETKSRKTFLDFETTVRLHLQPFFNIKPIEVCAALWPHYCAFERRRTPGRKLWHDRKTMSVILNYAFDCGYVEKKPKLKLDPFDKSRRVPREVTREEIELALRCSSPNLRDFLLVLYYTGMRFSEARHLQTKYINFETGELRLPATLTKTRRERLYYIPDELKTILKNRAIRAGEGFLFPSRSNPMEPMSESHRSFERMKKRTGLDFNLHDLRHSFVTRKIRAGMPAPLLGKLIGASKNILESVYLHPQFEDWKRFGESEPTLFQ